MYAVLALWTMASTWSITALWREADRQGRTPLWAAVSYVMFAAAGLYTHYAYAFVILAHNLGVLMWLWAGRRREYTLRRLLVWTAAQVAVALLFLPWLPSAWQQVTGWSPPRESHALAKALTEIWRLLNFGHTIPTEVVVGGLIAAGALTLLSLFPVNQTAEREGTSPSYALRWAMLALLIAFPTTLILALGLYKPAYEKFLLVAAAPLSLMVAAGSIGGWRIASGAGVWGERDATIGYRAVICFFSRCSSLIPGVLCTISIMMRRMRGPITAQSLAILR